MSGACGARSELLGARAGAEGGAGGDGEPEERSCLPNCTVGHLCCQGGCDGPPAPTENDCCECLDGEVNSSECPGNTCG